MPPISKRCKSSKNPEVTQRCKNNVKRFSRRLAGRNPELAQTDTKDSTTSIPIRGRRKARQEYRDDTLCFYDAAIKLKDNKITEDEYLDAIVAHCTGLRHGDYQLCNGDDPGIPDFWDDKDFEEEWPCLYARNVISVDPFASSISEFIAEYIGNDDQVQDTGPILQVLKAFRADDATAFRDGLDKMDETYLKPHEKPGNCNSLRWGLCHCLASLAIREKRIGVMKPILETDHKQCDSSFERGYVQLKKELEINQELIRVIDDSGFKSRAPAGKPFNHFTMCDLQPV